MATDAQLNARYIATDAAGNIYFTDPYYHRVRRIQMSGSDAGVVTTIAGTGAPGFSGDGDMAITAQFNQPAGIAVSADGSVYIADKENSRIRKIDPSGIVTTIAGGGSTPVANGSPATAALLREPRNIAMDASGNIYVCTKNLVRKINTSGMITGFAGKDTISGSGIPTTGVATTATLNQPEGIAVDASGNVYLCEAFDNMVVKINTSGKLTLYAGLGPEYGDGIPATSAILNIPLGIAIDGGGNVYIGEYGANRVRKVGDALAVQTVNNSPQNMEIFPNPGNGNFTLIVHSSIYEHVQVTIIDATGRIMAEQSADTNMGTNMQLDIPPGVYIIKTITSAQTLCKQLIIN